MTRATKKARGCMRRCRPPKGAREVMRRLFGKWVKDNGRPGVAFSYRDEDGFPMAGARPCDCSFLERNCQKRAAMDLTAQRWGCANGRDLPPLRSPAKGPR